MRSHTAHPIPSTTPAMSTTQPELTGQPNISRKAMRLLAPLLLATLTACHAIDFDPGFHFNPDHAATIINQTEDRFPNIDPLFLSDEIKAYADRYIHSGDGKETRVRKLQQMLFTKEFLNIQYSDTKTHTALEAFQAREGNCLSVMNLYIAMARYVNVDANFQTVKVQPSWDMRGNLLVLAQHINATGRFSHRRHYVVDFTPEIALQQLTASTIDDHEARALYFSNIGVEALIDNNLDEALIYFKNALFIAPDLSVAWNNIGTVYSRLGNQEFAEYSYHKAFALNNSSPTAISNLAKFYTRTGNEELAQKYALAVERFNKRNPYFHYGKGYIAWRDEDLHTARAFFQRAVRLKEQEPVFYVALAAVNLELGNVERAQELRDDAARLIALNEEIYIPSEQKVRIIDSATILRSTSAGISIIPDGWQRQRDETPIEIETNDEE
ncbi:MAG: transglutaminase domain-containing protein [Pseudohongiellaceae bacterium]